MSWTHTVLEIYPKPISGDLPTEGEPAEWIEQELVVYCQGEDRLVIIVTPIYVILRWKLVQWAEDVYDWLFDNVYVRTPWGKRHMAKVRHSLGEIDVLSDEQVMELFGPEDYSSLAELIGFPVPDALDQETKDRIRKRLEEKGWGFEDADEFSDDLHLCS